MPDKAFFISPQAAIEIEEIAFWYETKTPYLGNRFLESVYKCFSKIAESPSVFSFYKTGKPIRKSVMKGFPYTVYFIHSNNKIEILAIIHFRRSKGHIKKRLR